MIVQGGEMLVPRNRKGRSPFRVRSVALTSCLLAFALVFSRFARVDRAKPEPTAYEVELSQVRKDLAELTGPGSTPPADLEKATRFVYRLYHRASLTGNADDFKVAEAALNDAIRHAGPSLDLCLLKATLDFKFHRLAETRRDLAMVPGLAASAPGQTLIADLALQEGRYGEARKGLEAVVRKHRTWDNLARLAYWKAKTGDVSGAERLYAEAEDEITAKEMRSYSWVRLQRGLLALSHGRYEDAWEHYRAAGRAYSGCWLIDAHVAELLGAQGKFDEAAALYENVIARAPRPEIEQELGDLYVFMGEPDRAKPWHEKALTAYLASAGRGEVHYYHHLAALYADVRADGAEAVKWARKDLELRDNFATREALAWALYRQRRFAEAGDAIDKALASGVKDAHVFSHAAMIYLAAGRTDEGKQLLKKAAELNPHYENFHVHR